MFPELAWKACSICCNTILEYHCCCLRDCSVLQGLLMFSLVLFKDSALLQAYSISSLMLLWLLVMCFVRPYFVDSKNVLVIMVLSMLTLFCVTGILLYSPMSTDGPLWLPFFTTVLCVIQFVSLFLRVE